MASLTAQLDQVQRAWTVADYEAFVRFYVSIVPKVLDADRCSIFTRQHGTETVWSKLGTNLQEREIEAPVQGSFVGNVVSTGQVIIESNLEDRPGFHATVTSTTGFVTKNLACAPIKSLSGRGVIGAIEVLNKLHGNFTAEDGRRLQEIADCLAMAMENLLLNQEILDISNALNREVERYTRDYWGGTLFIAESAAMKDVMDLVHRVGKTPVSVLIQGENGTGKEVIAKMIHEGSDRHDRPFVAVNCASIPEHLMESEFFGYEKGAFTGAVSARPGRFEDAEGGTLFLDEIADMPLHIQPKFLRAIQEGEGSRLGSNKVTQYNLRIISATNKDLTQAVAQGSFREDLFYRLFSVEIHLPPLRERREDLVPLTLAFLNSVSDRFQKRVAGVSPELLSLFETYTWPGNVRQLLHEVERLIALTPEGQRLEVEHCSSDLQKSQGRDGEAPPSSYSLPGQVRDLEIRLITHALKNTDGNKRQAAKLLEITRQGLDKKLKRYSLQPNA